MFIDCSMLTTPRRTSSFVIRFPSRSVILYRSWSPPMSLNSPNGASCVASVRGAALRSAVPDGPAGGGGEHVEDLLGGHDRLEVAHLADAVGRAADEQVSLVDRL